MSVVVKASISNSLKKDFRIICIREGKNMSQVITELLEYLIKTEVEIPHDLKFTLDNPVVVKGYVKEDLKKRFKVFCTERKIPMNLALHYLIHQRVEMDHDRKIDYNSPYN